MATTKLYLDTRAQGANNSFPLKLKVTLNSTQGFMINLHTSLEPTQWDAKKCQVLDHFATKEVNLLLKQKQAQIDLILLKLAIDGRLDHVPPSEVKRMVCRGGAEEILDIDAKEYFKTYVAQKNCVSTRNIYAQTLSKVAAYSKGKLHFSDINFRWLKDFERHLSEGGLSINAINIHMRNLRAVFRNAINEDFVSQNLYPFNKFKLRTEQTKKRALTVGQLRSLRDYACEQGDVVYVDVFMLMFYLLGINVGDLLLLKSTDYIDGRIEFKRQKTRRLYSIKVEPEAARIIEKYRGEGYLLKFMDRFTDYNWFFRRMNKHLKRMGKVEVGERGRKTREPLFPNISTYWTRHSWATIAARIDTPRDTIAHALGHGTSTITDIYIDFDQKKVDEANRKVIDHVAGISTPSPVAS